MVPPLRRGLGLDSCDETKDEEDMRRVTQHDGRRISTGTTMKRLFAALAVFTLVCSGCGFHRNTGQFNMPVGEFEPVSAAVPGEYHLGTGDELRIKFLYHEDLNSEVTVRQDGDIALSGLGGFYAYGLTTAELEADINRRASLTYRGPEVSVLVVRQKAHRAYVGGEVKRPGFVDLRPGMTSLRAVFDRGGFSDTAKIDNVLHIRWEDSGAYAARVVDLKTVLESGDVRNDVILSANDIVFVPKTRIANADLWVQQYIRDLIPIREPTPRFQEIDY
ncbi:MAG: polysaccharide biosynthesis/export family protein [Candidatus Binatia bacterium]